MGGVKEREIVCTVRHCKAHVLGQDKQGEMVFSGDLRV